MELPRTGTPGVLALVFVGLGALTLFAMRPRWGELPHYEPETPPRFEAAFRTMAEHDAHMEGKSWPYVVALEPSGVEAGRRPADAGTLPGGGPALLYYGSWHTQDPADPQIARMRALWDEFGPTVAVTENRLGFYLAALGDGVGMHGEFALAGELGRRDGIPVYTLEPSWAVEVEALKREFSAEDLIVFYTLRVFLSERDGTAPEKRETLAEHLLGKRAGRAGLGREHVPDLARFDEVWRERFPGLGDWRTLPLSLIHI